MRNVSVQDYNGSLDHIDLEDYLNNEWSNVKHKYGSSLTAQEKIFSLLSNGIVLDGILRIPPH